MAIILLNGKGMMVTSSTLRRREAISFTLMGGGHPFTLIYIVYLRYIYRIQQYIYLQVKEMATLLLKVKEVTIMPFPLRMVMAIPLWRGGLASPSL